MSEQSYFVDSASAMQSLGERIGLKLQAGDLILLRGELGAGKTTFTQGVGRALGIAEITSPTFVITKIYPAPVPLVHVDAYRLIGNELATFDDLDLESWIPTSITLVEWGGNFVERLGESYIEVAIEFGAESDQRTVLVKGLDR
jgi:tRNA threonylcarbamoyladenosine biosynthesis protein TsaE